MTKQEALEMLDNFAADNPLEALREFADLMTPYRLDACAIYEPEAALVLAHDLLTPERRAECAAAAAKSELQRFVPDRLAAERRLAIAIARGTADHSPTKI